MLSWVSGMNNWGDFRGISRAGKARCREGREVTCCVLNCTLERRSLRGIQPAGECTHEPGDCRSRPGVTEVEATGGHTQTTDLMPFKKMGRWRGDAQETEPGHNSARL